MAARRGPERTLTEEEMTYISQEYGAMMEIATWANDLANKGRNLSPIVYKLSEPTVKQRIEEFIDWLSQDPGNGRSFPKLKAIAVKLKKNIQSINTHPSRKNIKDFTDILNELLGEQKECAPESKNEKELKEAFDKIFLSIKHGEQEYGDYLIGLINYEKRYRKEEILGKDHSNIFQQLDKNYHTSRAFLRKLDQIQEEVNAVEYASPREKVKILILKLNTLFNENMPKLVDDFIAGAKKSTVVSKRFEDRNIYKKYGKLINTLQREFIKSHPELAKNDAIQKTVSQMIDRVATMPITFPPTYEILGRKMMDLAREAGIVPREQKERKEDVKEVQGLQGITFLDTIKRELTRFSEEMKRALSKEQKGAEKPQRQRTVGLLPKAKERKQEFPERYKLAILSRHIIGKEAPKSPRSPGKAPLIPPKKPKNKRKFK